MLQMVEVHGYSRDFSPTKKTPPVESLVVSKKNGTGRISRHKFVVPGLSRRSHHFAQKIFIIDTNGHLLIVAKKHKKRTPDFERPKVFESFGIF